MSDSSPAPIVSDKVRADRELLRKAQAEGKVLGAYVRLSGPGWLQSAITLGGGTLAGSLFLGVLGGTSMLWLQVVAIIMGVVMLSAISYVTLSTGRRPFATINNDINPALGWGWLIATSLANMIWCMPQFSLCYDGLDRNLLPIFTGGTSGLGDSDTTKLLVTAIIFASAFGVVMLSLKQGAAAKLFDLVLKALIGIVVICFFGVVILLAFKGELNLAGVLAGLVPDLNQWNRPAGQLGALVDGLPQAVNDFWSSRIVESQRSVMIAAAASAVGINMTFLLPYSMLTRGWDKPFRGLARFDLSTGMAIPYVLVTSCVVIASAASFHARIDDSLKSTDSAVMQTSPLYPSVKDSLLARIALTSETPVDQLDEASQLAMMASLDESEKILAAALVKRDAFQLSETLSPLLGANLANLVFGLGVFGMGFSTIIILMLINGYVFREMTNQPNATAPFVIGCLVAGISGASWVYLWSGGAKFWLPIIASGFGAMLLPVAYVTFFLMMNSKRILGDEKPQGASMWCWNALMAFAVVGAIVAAQAAIRSEMAKSDLAGKLIVTVLVVYALLIAAGFVYQAKRRSAAAE